MIDQQAGNRLLLLEKTRHDMLVPCFSTKGYFFEVLLTALRGRIAACFSAKEEHTYADPYGH